MRKGPRSRWIGRSVNAFRRLLAPDGRKPRLLLARQTFRTIVVRELDEPGARHIAAPGLGPMVGAVPAAIPSLLVVAVRIRAEKDTARSQRRAQLAQDTRQFLRWNMKQGRVGEHAVEAVGRKVQLEKILLPHRAAGVLARHRSKAPDAFEADRGMAELHQRPEVAARSAAQIENREGRRTLDVVEQGADVLADVMVARSLPERIGTLAIVIERSADNRGHFVGLKLDLHPAMRHLAAERRPARRRAVLAKMDCDREHRCQGTSRFGAEVTTSVASSI